MNIIYTNENDCRDCYKCIRNCPVKAISMIDHHASIDDKKCIVCGECVHVCPVGAQKYRNDESKVLELLVSEKKVFLSLAPSFVTDFDIPVDDLLEQLYDSGFEGISETALGAQLVSYEQKELLNQSDKSYFSTACPTFVNTILKHYPSLKQNLSDIYSPLLAHCAMLKKTYGEDIAIVFAGPCFSKKIEADTHPELLNVALTFEELKNLLKNKHLYKKKSNKQNTFIPVQSSGGAIYPLDGGMIETITDLTPTSVTNTGYFNFSGIEEIIRILENEDFDNQKVFCEFLACKGGCINGPGISNNDLHIISKKEKISKYFKSLPQYSIDDFAKKYHTPISTSYNFCEPVKKHIYTQDELKKIYKKLGKLTPKDFIDCGACGYNTCEEFAIACINKQAELTMCVSSMRKLATDKVKSLMKAIPLGLCIVDNNLKIVECNDMFIKLSVDSDIDVSDSLIMRVVGNNIKKYFEIDDSINKVLASKESTDKIIQHEGRILSINLFIFGSETLVGFIINDITEPAMKKEVVVDKAKKVIKNNLLTIQKIAYLLGETASETEITLNEIIKAYNSNETK